MLTGIVPIRQIDKSQSSKFCYLILIHQILMGGGQQIRHHVPGPGEIAEEFRYSEQCAARGHPGEGRGGFPLVAANSALLGATPGKTAEKFRYHQ